MDDMKSAIKGIASKGRNGDNMLVHMAPDEVAGIASLGGVSINPETGLPEMFKFRDFLKIAAPIGLSIAMPYFAPKIATGLGAGSGLTQFLGGTAGFLLGGSGLGSGLGFSFLGGLVVSFLGAGGLGFAFIPFFSVGGFL